MNRNTHGFKNDEAESKARGYDVYEDSESSYISESWSLVCHNDECTYVHGPHQHDNMAYKDKRDAEIVVFGKNVYDKINAKGISMSDFLASLDDILEK